MLYSGGNRGRALMKIESVGLHDETGLTLTLPNKPLCVLEVRGGGMRQKNNNSRI